MAWRTCQRFSMNPYTLNEMNLLHHYLLVALSHEWGWKWDAETLHRPSRSDRVRSDHPHHGWIVGPQQNHTINQWHTPAQANKIPRQSHYPIPSPPIHGITTAPLTQSTIPLYGPETLPRNEVPILRSGVTCFFGICASRDGSTGCFAC